MESLLGADPRYDRSTNYGSEPGGILPVVDTLYAGNREATAAEIWGILVGRDLASNNTDETTLNRVLWDFSSPGSIIVPTIYNGTTRIDPPDQMGAYLAPRIPSHPTSTTSGSYFDGITTYAETDASSALDLLFTPDDYTVDNNDWSMVLELERLLHTGIPDAGGQPFRVRDKEGDLPLAGAGATLVEVSGGGPKIEIVRGSTAVLWKIQATVGTVSLALTESAGAELAGGTNTLVLSRNEDNLYLSLYAQHDGSLTETATASYDEAPPDLDITDYPQLYLGAHRDSAGRITQHFEGCIRTFSLNPFPSPSLDEDKAPVVKPSDARVYFDFTTKGDSSVIKSEAGIPLLLEMNQGEILGETSEPPFFVEGSIADGEAHSLVAGVVSNSGGFALPDGTRLAGKRVSPSGEETNGVRVGDKVFLSSGSKGYVIDEDRKAFRPLGLPRPEAMAPVAPYPDGAIGDPSEDAAVTYAYRFVSRDGTASSIRRLNPTTVSGSYCVIGDNSGGGGPGAGGGYLDFPHADPSSAKPNEATSLFVNPSDVVKLETLFDSSATSPYLATQVSAELSDEVDETYFRERYLDRGLKIQKDVAADSYQNHACKAYITNVKVPGGSGGNDGCLGVDFGGFSLGFQMPGTSSAHHLPENSTCELSSAATGAGCDDIWMVDATSLPAGMKTTTHTAFHALASAGKYSSHMPLSQYKDAYYAHTPLVTLGLVYSSSTVCNPAILIPKEEDCLNGWEWTDPAYTVSTKSTDTYDLGIFSDIDLVGGEEYILGLFRGQGTDKGNTWDLYIYTRSTDTWTKSTEKKSGTTADIGWENDNQMQVCLGGMRGAGLECHKLLAYDLAATSSESLSIQPFQSNGAAEQAAGRISGLRVLKCNNSWMENDIHGPLKLRYLDISNYDEATVLNLSSNVAWMANDERDRLCVGFVRLDTGSEVYVDAWKRGGWPAAGINLPLKQPVRGDYTSHYHSDRDIPIFGMGAVPAACSYYSDISDEMFMSPIGEFSLGYYNKVTRTVLGNYDGTGNEVRIFTKGGWNWSTTQDTRLFSDTGEPWSTYNKYKPYMYTVTYKTSGSGIAGATSDTNNSLYLWPQAAFLNSGVLAEGFQSPGGSGIHTSGLGIGSRVTEWTELPWSGNAPPIYHTDPGARGLLVYDARLWKTQAPKFSTTDPSTFQGYLGDPISESEWNTMICYFRMMEDDRIGTGYPLVVDNIATGAGTNVTDLDCQPDCTLEATSAGDLSAGASGALTGSPNGDVVALEYLRSLAYAYDATDPEEESKAKEASQGGPFFIVGATPVEATSYTDNAPQSSLKSYVGLDSGYTPDTIDGFAVWQGFLCVWGDPGAPTTLYFAEPGPFGWESFPESMKYTVPSSESGTITSVETIGSSALVMGRGFVVLLQGDPTAPTSRTIGGGVGAHNSDTTTTYSGMVFAYNGTLWAISEAGEAQDIGGPVRDMLPTPSNARLKVSSTLASLFVIDKSTRKALRYHFPTQQWLVENRNIKDLGDYRGTNYFIHNKGHVAEESNVYYEDDLPPGTPGIGGGYIPAGYSPLGGEVTMDGVAFNTTAFYPGYDKSEGKYQDYIGMRVLSLTSGGAETSATVDYNTSSTLYVVGGSGGWTNGVPAPSAAIYLGVPDDGFGIDTGSITLNEQGQESVQSLVTAIDISATAPSGVYIQHSAESRPDDPRDASSVGAVGSSGSDSPITLGTNPDERVGVATRGRWHRFNLKSVIPAATKIRYVEASFTPTDEEEATGDAG